MPGFRAKSSPADRETTRPAVAAARRSRVSNSEYSSSVVIAPGTWTGQNPVPQPGQYLAGISVAEFRQFDILLTPHGFLKAALAAANPTAISLTFPGSPCAITQNGKATLVSFTAMG